MSTLPEVGRNMTIWSSYSGNDFDFCTSNK